MGFFSTLLQVVLAYGSLVLLIWAFVDATRFDRADYQVADRMPRLAWLVLFGFAFAMLLWLGAWQPSEPFGPRSIMWVASMLAVGVYFYDMRPKLLNARIARRG